jgi:predicted nucleic acid-binding protein
MVGLAEGAVGDSTIYDSAYIAAAQRLSSPLVTADEMLARRFKNANLDVRFLGDWPD